MNTALSRHCNRCLALARRSGLSWPLSSQTRLEALHPKSQTVTAAAFSSSQPKQQIREAFLRAGPGRELGASLRRSQVRSSSEEDASLSCSASASPDQAPQDPEEQDISVDQAIKSTSPSSSSRNSPASSVPYKEIVLLETDFRERFIKGGGNGGQKINKTNSNVELKHYETGIVVQCQATRSLPQNRKLARRILIDRLDEYYNGDMSKRGQKAEKIRHKKMRMARKSAKKYHGSGNSSGGTGGQDGHDDSDYEEDDKKGGNDSEENGDSGKTKANAGLKEVPEITIQLTTLEEILASDNKKQSRRKAARKD
ncbi:RF-1 domain-containing protein [Dissophora ornata]|nr:RF-1 domain-containing protein [Dissophora ornata]